MTTTDPLVRRRREVDAELRVRGEASVKRDEWDQLLDEGAEWVNAQSATGLAERVETWRRLAVAAQPDDRDDHGFIPHRRSAPRWLWAKSLLIAAEASDDEAVIEFRRLYLPDGLLREDAVSAWVEARARTQSRRVTVEAYLPEGWTPGDPIPQLEPRIVEAPDGRVWPVPTDPGFLEWAGEAAWRELVPVDVDGVLAELRALSLRLARRYPWQTAQATSFVLTGATPVCIGIQASMTLFTTQRRRTITMEIDPEMSVDDVAATYAAIRRNQLGPKPRAVSERTVELLIDRGSDPAAADHVLYGRWNRRCREQQDNNVDGLHPDQSFATIRAFRQALRDGTRRLLDGPRTGRPY